MNASHPQAASPFPLLIGIPDDRQATVRARSSGALNYVLIGNARVATDLEPAVKQRMLRVVFGPDVPIRIPPALRAHACINSIGDADVSAIALHMLEEHLAASGSACFNHPTAVLGTTRERVAEKLAAIDGLQVPRTLRLRLDEPADLVRAVDQHGLGWPLIVRTAGTHRGTATVRIDRPEDVRAALRKLVWGGHDLYLTEYVDSRDADGHFRKLRLVVIGDGVFVRHWIATDHWMVHGDDRDLEFLHAEAHLLATYRSTLLPELAVRLRAIADAIDLDYFGIDCNLRPDGRLLIYEANPLMDNLTHTMPRPNCWDEPVREMRAALGALLVDPARWRHPA
jgi:glutathione synthase/RimK-type ligase-like ATP-grasp enzyme